MTVCRGLRGATRSDGNTEEEIHGATREMLQQLIEANGIVEEDVAMAYFTVTPDLNAAFPRRGSAPTGLESYCVDVRHRNCGPKLLAELHSRAYTYQH